MLGGAATALEAAGQPQLPMGRAAWPALGSPRAGELPGSPVFFYPALGVVAPAPLYMARADCGAYPGGGTATPPPANHTAPGGGSPHSIDALKSRVLESAPGEVKQIIAASRLPLRAAAFTSLIQMAAKAKQPQKAREIFEAMASAGVQPNTFSYSALISALARAGRWQEAEAFFAELRRRAARAPELAPNTVTYASLISAYEKGGQLERALAAFAQQLEAGVPPDLITYSSLITACQRGGELAQAADLLDRMHAGGMAGSAQLYHGVLQACQAAGAGQLALEVFLGMQCAGVRPTSQTVALVLGALVGGGAAGDALWLLREGLRQGFDLGAPAFNGVLQLLAARGDWQRALALQRAMGLAKVRPDSQTAQLLVTACARGGNHPLAAQLAAELAAQGLLPPPGAPPPPTDGAPWLEAHSRSSSSSGATDGSARTDGSAAAAGARGDGPKQQQALLASGRRA